MQKTIAVITGASSGMGAEFVRTIESFGVRLDEIWAIARRQERLKALQAPCPVRPLALDLTDPASFSEYQALLEQEQPRVALLINASGFGKFAATWQTPLAVTQAMVALNCQAVLAMCQLTLPYLGAGSCIVNIASVAAFQPIPYINVYAASKAFVLQLSRALNREVRPQGIRVMALCPFWTKTEFFDRAIDAGREQIVKKYTAMYDPAQIVRRAWRDLARGKDVSKYGFVARFQAALCKLLPHSFVMTYWMHQQKLP